MLPEERTYSKNQKWINAALLALVMFTCLGFCSSNKGLYLTAITDAIDTPRTVFSLAISCRYIATAVINIFFGSLVMKFGEKKLMLAGIIALIISMILNVVAKSVPLFFISEMFCGIGFSWSGTTIVGCVVNRWFDTNRGTVSGAILCANGFGGAVAAQIVTPLIYNENNIFGYRDAYKLIAVILAVLFVIVLLFFKDKKSFNLDAPTVKKKKRGGAWSGIAFSDALKRPYFYGAAACIFFIGMILQGVGTITSAQMLDCGIDSSFVGAVASVGSILLSASKFLTGFMYDKFGLRVTITVNCVAGLLNMFLLVFVSSSMAGHIISTVATVCYSVALPLETIVLPIYANDFFGDRDYDKILGIFVSFNTLGYATGTPLFNLGYDITGSYTSVLIIMGIQMLITVIALQFVISAAHKTRRKIESEQGA